MKIDHYLKRIGATDPVKTDISYLTHLQQQHVRNVPFENLDIKTLEKNQVREMAKHFFELNI